MSSPVGATHLVLNDGNTIPVLGLWTWRSAAGKIKASVEKAIDCGYRHIDSSPSYENEKEVGEALKAKFDEGLKREDIFITSKLWCTKRRAEDVRPALLKTLADLQVSYLDLFLIHTPIAYQPGDALWPKDENGNVITTNLHFSVTWKEMEKAVDDGLVKSIGVGNFNSEQVKELYENSRIKPAVLQCESHPYMTQVPLINFCKERKIAFTAFSPMPSADRPFAQPGDPVLLFDPKLIAIGKKYNKTASQICLKFQIQRGITVIFRSVDPNQIEEYSEIFDFKMSEEDIKTVESFNQNWRSCVIISKKADGRMGYMLDEHYLFPFNIPF